MERFDFDTFWTCVVYFSHSDGELMDERTGESERERIFVEV